MKTLKCLLLCLCIGSQLTAQIDLGIPTVITRAPDFNVIVPDTITLARNCAYQKDFQKSDELLTRYNADHTDFSGLSLHAQVLYWMQAYDRSITVYEKTIQTFPAPSSIHLDYARVLFSLGKLSKASRLLEIFSEFDSTNAEAAIMTGYIELWNGHIQSAKKISNQLLSRYPGNAEAKDILNKINYYTVPVVKAGTEIISDDQPMKGNAYYAAGEVYKSWLLAPRAQAAIYHYKVGDSSFHSSWIQLGNTIQIGRKDKVKFKAGTFQQNGKASEFTAGAEVSHQFTRELSLQAGIERRPYQYTVSSVKMPVMENYSAISLSYVRNDKWYGKVAYESLHYKDANRIQNAYLWILAPVISRPHFSISAGYAFQYADALNSNYVSKKPLSEVITQPPPPNGLEGVYVPYFTPENQVVHNALASIKIIPSKKIQFTTRVSFGFSGKADNPYLWLDKDAGDFVIYRAHAPVEFKPATWVNELSFAPSAKLFITAIYSYDKLLYYKNHKAAIELKYLFLK